MIHDRVTGTTTQVTNVGSSNDRQSISDDGRYVAYRSYSTQTATPLPVQHQGVYVWDRVTDATSLIAIQQYEMIDGWQYNWGPPMISGNGRYVAFTDHSSTYVAG